LRACLSKMPESAVALERNCLKQELYAARIRTLFVLSSCIKLTSVVCFWWRSHPRAKSWSSAPTCQVLEQSEGGDPDDGNDETQLDRENTSAMEEQLSS
jgi:hypothetical protein